MSSDAPNWRQSIITRIIDRNKRESSYHRELIQQNNRFYDTVVQLEAENLRINVENEKLRTAVATGGKDSGGSFAVLERLLAEQKHLTELHKRKGDNSQMIVDLSMKVEEQRKLLSEREQNCAEHMKMNQILRAESAMLKSSLEELKKLDTTLRDEHTALQLAFSALEEKMRGIQDENRSLLERLMKYKSKDADKLNEENESIFKKRLPSLFRKRSDKLRRDLEDAVRETRNSNSPNDLPPESAGSCSGDQGGGEFIYDEMLMLPDEGNLSPGIGPERFHSADPELLMKFEAHETEASAVRWNPVEKMVATGGADRRVKLWDVNKHITGTTTEARAVLGGSSAGINSVEFDSTGSYILGTSNDFGARLWTVADHRLRMSNSVRGYYKIVQTIFNGKSKLFVVPSGWVKDEVLFWPSKAAGAAAMLSIKDPNSVPGENGWSELKCITKLHCLDFETGVKEINKMLTKIDKIGSSSSSSSGSSSETKNKTNLTSKRQSPRISVKPCFTSVVAPNKDSESILDCSDAPSEMTNDPEPSTSLEVSASETRHPLQSQLASQSQSLGLNITKEKQLCNDNPTVGPSLRNLMEVLQKLSENVLTLNTKSDDMNKKIDLLIERTDSKPLSKVLPIPFKAKMEPIKTLDELYEFEENLKKNKEFTNSLIEKLKNVCGENSMKGENAAYTLVDVIFSRQLMTHLSWAGGSKKGGKPKKAFKQLEHVLKFFYTLVKKSDPTYTENDAKDFFRKKVLPNSVRRSLAPLIRASQPKTRLKKMKKPEEIGNFEGPQLLEDIKEQLDTEEEEDDEEEEEYETLGTEEFLIEDLIVDGQLIKEEEEFVEEQLVNEADETSPPLKRRKMSRN